VLSQNKIIIQ